MGSNWTPLSPAQINDQEIYNRLLRYQIEKECVEYMVKYIKHLNEHHFDHSKIPKLYEMLMSEDGAVRDMGKEIINSFINE